MTELEITAEELAQLDADSVVLVDLRDELSYRFGHIPGAINLPVESVSEQIKAKDKTVCFYCGKGIVSLSAAEEMKEKGFRSVSLKGGYFAWLRAHLDDMDLSESVRLNISTTCIALPIIKRGSKN